VKVWEVEWNGNRCGGLAVVAADTEEQVLPLVSNAQVFGSFMEIDDVKVSLLGGVTADREKPVLLTAWSYAE
jgi:hypothetical protein